MKNERLHSTSTCELYYYVTTIAMQASLTLG